MIPPASHISPYTSLFSFIVGLPTLVATYYQAWKTRQENTQLRESLAFSSYCLEFVLNDGNTVNVVSLDSLHSLPSSGQVVLLPGQEQSSHAAYRVLAIEHIYSRVGNRHSLAAQAHLVKTVAHIQPLNPVDGDKRPLADLSFTSGNA